MTNLNVVFYTTAAILLLFLFAVSLVTIRAGRTEAAENNTLRLWGYLTFAQALLWSLLFFFQNLPDLFSLVLIPLCMTTTLWGVFDPATAQL